MPMTEEERREVLEAIARDDDAYPRDRIAAIKALQEIRASRARYRHLEGTGRAGATAQKGSLSPVGCARARLLPQPGGHPRSLAAGARPAIQLRARPAKAQDQPWC